AGVVGGHDHGGEIQDAGEALHLLDAGGKEMAGVFVGRLTRGDAIVNFLRAGAGGDTVVFDAGETADVRRRQIRADVIKVQIETDVAVEIPVARVAGITLVPAPNLFGGIQVAAKSSDAVRREDRRKHAEARTRVGVQHAVRVRDEPADVRLLHNIFHTGGVSAFGQPDAARIATETTAVMIA